MWTAHCTHYCYTVAVLAYREDVIHLINHALLFLLVCATLLSCRTVEKEIIR